MSDTDCSIGVGRSGSRAPATAKAHDAAAGRGEGIIPHAPHGVDDEAGTPRQGAKPTEQPDDSAGGAPASRQTGLGLAVGSSKGRGRPPKVWHGERRPSSHKALPSMEHARRGAEVGADSHGGAVNAWGAVPERRGRASARGEAREGDSAQWNEQLGGWSMGGAHAASVEPHTEAEPAAAEEWELEADAVPWSMRDRWRSLREVVRAYAKPDLTPEEQWDVDHGLVEPGAEARRHSRLIADRVRAVIESGSATLPRFEVRAAHPPCVRVRVRPSPPAPW